MAKEKGKGLISEFKEFIMRGNVLDLAVGVIIGAAFQAIVNSLVNDIIMPVISLVTGGKDFSEWQVSIGESATLNYGNFISAVINFLIMAIVIFIIVKSINKVSAKFSKKEEEAPAEPTTKVCPYCKSEIPVDAVKCAHCASDLS